MSQHRFSVMTDFSNSQKKKNDPRDSGRHFKFLIFNWYNRNNIETSQNDSVSIGDETIGDASPSSNTSHVIEGDPPSSDSSHK